ncbi:hypothetical protein VPHD81_0114 [Vibrio phage D81]
MSGVDCRSSGQTEHEYNHQVACGYVRKSLTTDKSKVTCFYCKRIMDGKTKSPY